MSTTLHTKSETVQSVELYQFDGTDVWQEDDKHARLRGYFPLSPGTPNASDVFSENLTIVCLEIAPNDYLPTHTDSNEELLLVTAGIVEASIGNETVELSEDQCAIVPEMVPHGLRNIGEVPARVIGFFPDNKLTSTFEKPLMPFESNVVSINGDAEIEE